MLSLTAFHETFHWLGKQGKLGARYQKTLIDNIIGYLKGSEDYDYEAIRQQRIDLGYSEDKVDEEIAAQYFGTILAEREFQKYAAEQDAPLWKRIIDHVKAFIEDIRNRIEQRFGSDRAVQAALMSDVEFVERQVKAFDIMLERVLEERAKGEIEALDALENRINLNAEERKNTRQDIDRTDVVFADGGVNYSIAMTDDDQYVAVVDKDILTGMNTEKWNNAKDEAARKAVLDEIKKIGPYILAGNLRITQNKDTRREYIESEYTEKLKKRDRATYLEKLKLANAYGDAVRVATNWELSSELKHNRNDRYIMFAHADTLLSDEINGYKARIAVGVTNQGQFVLYDLVDIKPANFKIKKTLTLPDGSTKADTTTQSNKNLKQSIPQTAKKSQEDLSLVDDEYMKAVDEGDEEAQARLVEQAARKAGYNSPRLYHGTNSFGFTAFDANKGMIFATNKKAVADSYTVYYGGEQNTGVYELYGRLGKSFAVDAKGARWTSIKTAEFDSPVSTNTVAKWAFDNGYDSVIIRDVIDYSEEEENNNHSDVYVFKNSAAVKSADPVTYDDQGNVILPSERFNAEKEDIRWSVNVDQERRGNGYDGYSMSNNARAAYEAGEKPISKWTKAEIIDAVSEIDEEKANMLTGVPLRTLKDKLLYKSSWHHTSGMYNRTDFYAVDEDVLENLTQNTVNEWMEIPAVPKPETNTYRGAIDYIEWEGTRKHPKAVKQHLDNVNIEERGSFYIVTDAEGKEILRKKIGSNGTFVINYDEQERRKQKQAEETQRYRENSSEAAYAFFRTLRRNGMDVSTSGNMYERGRKPSRWDYENGLENFHTVGEHRLYNDAVNKKYLLETWDGSEWVKETDADYSVDVDSAAEELTERIRMQDERAAETLDVMRDLVEKTVGVADKRLNRQAYAKLADKYLLTREGNDGKLKRAQVDEFVKKLERIDGLMTTAENKRTPLRR